MNQTPTMTTTSSTTMTMPASKGFGALDERERRRATWLLIHSHL
jgi:hypothetical protein